MLDLDCEDYGLLFRLAGNGRPMLRVDAGAEFGGDVPLFNTLAVIRGVEKPDEYVLLSAHLDSWDGASGATDNGSGTVVVMEAMRLLRQAYPRPRRTILVGHWSGEEQGLNGSLAFAADHPEVVRGLQAVFNQDQGTGRTRIVSMQGLTGAEAHFRRWLSRVPPQLGVRVELVTPGTADASGSDHASFVCRGAPAFNLESVEWDYRTYTWHTDRDTFDKLVPDDLRHNAVLTAMLAYLASEDPDRVPRERTAGPLPVCRKPARSMVEFFESLAQ
jgi:Zn-dependent M28 family amino/carboxypeptidase